MIWGIECEKSPNELKHTQVLYFNFVMQIAEILKYDLNLQQSSSYSQGDDNNLIIMIITNCNRKLSTTGMAKRLGNLVTYRKHEIYLQCLQIYIRSIVITNQLQLGLDQLFFFLLPIILFFNSQTFCLRLLFLLKEVLFFFYHPLFSSLDDKVLIFTLIFFINIKSKIDTKLTARFRHNKVPPTELESY